MTILLTVFLVVACMLMLAAIGKINENTQKMLAEIKRMNERTDRARYEQSSLEVGALEEVEKDLSRVRFVLWAEFVHGRLAAAEKCLTMHFDQQKLPFCARMEEKTGDLALLIYPLGMEDGQHLAILWVDPEAQFGRSPSFTVEYAVDVDGDAPDSVGVYDVGGLADVVYALLEYTTRQAQMELDLNTPSVPADPAEGATPA